MSRGGRRPGAGRKPAIDVLLRAAQHAGYTPQQLAMLEADMLLAQHRAAMRGNVAAGIAFLRRAGFYCHGISK